MKITVKITQFCISILLCMGLSSITFAAQKTASNSDQAVNTVIPISPEQVKALHKKQEAVNRALQYAPINSAQLAQTVRSINLTDHAAPPLLHLVQGYATNVSFIGENGKPWPIESVQSGGSAIAVTQPSKDNPYNSSLHVNQAWISSNVTFYLKDRVRPVTLYFYTASDASQGLDGNVTVKLDGLPSGTSPLPIKNVTAVSDELLNALDHAPGSNWSSVRLNNTNLPVSIHFWIAPDHHRAIVRLSSGTLILPEWGSQASSPDGNTTAYEFNYVPLMLQVDSNDGQSFQIRVDDATQLIAGGEPIMKAKNTSPITINRFRQSRGMYYAK